MSSADTTRQRKFAQERTGLSGANVGRKGLSEDEATKQASNSWIYYFVLALCLSTVLLIGVAILLPSPIKPVEISGLSSPPEFVGPMAPNNFLTYAEKIYHQQLSGAESLVVDGDHIYTGTADGWVVHLYQGEVQKIVRFGKEPCGGYENENTCGRPLGMRMGKNGYLIVADGYYGLFRVNVVTGDYTTLYSASTPINGKTSKFVNDLDIGPDGKVYFTDSSTKWNRNQFLNIFMEGIGNGRLLMYDPATGTTVQLLGGLVFANGVQLTKDKSAVLVTETCRARILKYDLKTKKSMVWADNLPGTTDNIRYSKTSGTYWVGLATVRQAGKLSLVDLAAPYPKLRGFLAKFVSIKSFLWITKYFSSTDVKTLAVELNENGKIINSLQDKTGDTMSSVSEVSSENGIMHFGSFHANYVGRLFRKRVPGLR